MRRILATAAILVAAHGAAASARADADLIAGFLTAPDSALTTCDPDVAWWEHCATYDVTVIPQTVTTPSLMDAEPDVISVRAVHNGRWVAFRLEWADSTRDASVEVSRFSDQVAIQWPISLDPGVSPFMGNPGDPAGRVHIVHWKAIWQDDLDKGYQDVQALHPNFWSDFYYMLAQEPYPYPVARSFNSPEARVALMGIYAGNPVAQPQRPTPVEELIAQGFGTLTTQPRQNSVGRGVWSDGRWRVVFARPLVTDDPADAPLQVGRELPTAFALWDGAIKNVGARKRFAPWITLVLELPR
jgi:hypothetical protein